MLVVVGLPVRNLLEIGAKVSMTLAEAAENVLGRVAYTPPHGQGEPEKGVIESVNAKWAFVRYGRSSRAIATAPENLTLLTPPPMPAERAGRSRTRSAR